MGKEREMAISYNRTFMIQASHFNGQKAYDVYYRLRECAEVSNEEVLDLLADIHGHNFRIVVDAELASKSNLDSDGFVIDDMKLEQIIRRYDRQNISVHPDFIETGERATTENIANRYAHQIFDAFDPKRWRFHKVTVTVHETDDIFATATVWSSK